MNPLVLLIALGLSGPPPRVDPEAWAMAQDGLQAYERGDFEVARDNLRRAYAKSPHPAILYAWAQTERNAGNCAAAVPLYELFLETAPPQKSREFAEHHLEACRADLRRSPATPEEVPKPPPPVVKPPLPRPTDTPPPAERRPKPDATAVALLVTGSAAFATGVVLLAVAQARVAVQGDTRDYDRFDSLDRQIRDLRISGGVVLGASVPLLVVGIVRATRARRALRR